MSAMGAASTPALGWDKIVNLGIVWGENGWWVDGWAYLAAAEADCDDA